MALPLLLALILQASPPPDIVTVHNPLPPAPAPILPSASPPVPLRGSAGCNPRIYEDGRPASFVSCFYPWDYPAAAYEARQQGKVGIRFTIGATAEEMRCEVTRPSGSAILDRETCAMLSRRVIPFRYSRPRIAEGEVEWILPDSLPADTRTPLSTYFSPDDYPAAALRANEQGVVGFVLDVTAEGRVSDCRLYRSSGSNALDNATCRVLRERARLLPARDAAGHAVASRASGSLGWRLPDE